MPRSANRTRRTKNEIAQQPWTQFVNPLPPIEPFSVDEIERIHLASLQLLAEVGMVVHDAGARERLAQAGCDVDHGAMRVRFDPGFVETQVAKAPRVFTLRAQNPDRDLTFGDAHVNFASVVGPAFCSDLDQGRRPGTTADVRNFVRLQHALNAIHLVYGIPFEAMDLRPEHRHLEGYLHAVELSDKVWGAWLLGRFRAVDAVEMAALALETDLDDMAARPACIGVVNVNSPLVLDAEMAQGGMAFAELGQAVVVTPFTLAGAMAPATVAGALVGQNAESLACIALLQTVRPGAPVVYGSFASNVDMRTGSPAFGTPEYAKAALASGQLARRYGLPWRSSNACAANIVDAQAAYESNTSLWATVMAHCNMVIHAGGWLEGGLTASFEKLIVDAEMLQMMMTTLAPMALDDAALGLDAYREVGPGGHFFGASDTLARYERAFYAPLVSDVRNFESWSDAGGLTALERANGVWKRLLETYAPPPHDPEKLAALRAFVERRKGQIAAA